MPPNSAEPSTSILVQILKVSKIVAQFLWSQRYSTSAVVRRAVLLSVRSLTMALPTTLIETDADLLNELQEIMLWAKGMFSDTV
jgi:hypothetical protein